jgi:hypothetical protein
MDCSIPAFRNAQASRFSVLIKRTFVLLLLLSVPVLTTLARNNWYLPQSNPGHYLTTASKTKVASSSMEVSQPQIETIVEATPPLPEPPKIRRSESAPTIVWTDLPVVVQHRPPPFLA